MNRSQPSILVYSPKQADAYAAYIRDSGFTYIKVASTFDEAEKYLPDTEIILGWKFPVQLLKQPIAASVRWYQSTGAGVDDLVRDTSFPKDIILTRIVDQFGAYITEYVFSYLLYLVKDIPRMRQAQMEQRWDPFLTESLAGKTLGVAGIGSIGAEIVRKARAFDMQVHGLSISGEHAQLVDRHYYQDQWKEFVRDLDYLVLTLPLTNETYHCVKRDILLAMKPNACILNVGRGALIDERDLLTVMHAGHLRAAVLDVFEMEPLPKDHAFYSLPNIYITAHLSGPSTVAGVGRFFVENVNRYLQNQPLQGLVDLERGY